MEKKLVDDALESARKWIANPCFDVKFQKEIQSLIDKDEKLEILDRFYKDLEFGTGGLRAIIGAGRNRINTYTVAKATQALADTLKALKKETLKVAISYDSRRFSKDFAQKAAEVLAGNGIFVYFYPHLNPVALLSFAIRYYKTDAGIMITASHNPPHYNGYKTYWNDGAQVTPPHDQLIIENYKKITDFSQIASMDFQEGLSKKIICFMDNKVEDAYFASIKQYTINKDLCRKKGCNLSIIYTPIHGTGLNPCTRALKQIGFSNITVVPEQARPDGAFPTVKSPNPEDPSALKMAVDLLEKIDGDIVFGSDPDTDRIGLALKHQGTIHYPNGNQIGLLLLHYLCSQKSQNKTLSDKSYFIKTIVTSPLQGEMARHFGVEEENTLTGFKWICRRMKEIEENQKEREFLFATEESFGYLNHGFIRDKDGIAPLTLLAEITLYYKERKKTLMDALDDIYREFGFSQESLLSLSYEGKKGAEKIDRIMAHFRNLSRKKELAGEKLERVEDYSKGIDNIPPSDVLGFIFSSKNRFYLRPSGTEPKIKFYIMIQQHDGGLAEKKKNACASAKKFLEFLKKEAHLA
ncbi:MAG: phospho-sugar mutase [Halobacteriovoraceae bacterium]|nr:phospho-sugar mutase [Halobacteriovoraceae bacterium]